MEDRRAHTRIDALEEKLTIHFDAHAGWEKALTENTALTKTIAANTAELVILVKGAKGLRAFLLWVTPIAVALEAVYLWWRSH